MNILLVICSPLYDWKLAFFMSPCANIETSSTASGPLGSDAAFFRMWWLEPRISGAHPELPHRFLIMSHPRSPFSRFSSLFLFAAIFRSVPQYNPVWSSGGWTGDLMVTPIKVWKHLQDEQETPVQVLQQSVSIPLSTRSFSFYLICLKHGE